MKKRRLVLQESQYPSSSFHHNDEFLQRHHHHCSMTALYNASTLEGKNKQASFHSMSSSHAPFALLPEHTMALSTCASSASSLGGGSGLDSKIAALALVAAAASCSNTSNDDSYDENKNVRLNSFHIGGGSGGGTPFLPMLNGPEEESKNQYPKDSAFASLLSATLSSKTDTPKCYQVSERGLYESHINIDDDDDNDEDDEDDHGQKQDTHQVASASMRTCAPTHFRPTVAAPSHCNGNKRSKLTLTLKQKRAKQSEDTDDRTVSSSSDTISSPPALVSPQPRRKVIKTTTTTTQSNHPSSSAAVASGAATSQQDKRYTGAADETRCHATTTRGRPCSYIAVKGTSYCHLHADYDANPPPRRGGQNQKASTQVSKQDLSRMPSSPSPLSPIPKTSTLQAPPCAEVSITSPPSVSSEESTARLSSSSPLPSEANTATTSAHKTVAAMKKKSGRRTSSKLAELHAESPRPLLSMIATEEWFGKRVHIASGPMADRQGTVEKWGNGWISVYIPGVGLHNRRSFELYLVDDQDDEEREAVTTKRRNGEAGSEDQSVQGDDAAIARCVSSDAMSPLRLDDDSTNQPAKSRKLPPKLTLHIGSVENKSRRSQASPIPETPRVVDHQTGMTTDDVPMLTQTCTKDSEDESFQDDALPKVTPDSPPKRTVERARLDDEVAATSTNKKHKYDMLFGTAALDRGRRTISKPTRYEATAIRSPQHHNKRPKKQGDVAALVASDVSIKSSTPF